MPDRKRKRKEINQNSKDKGKDQNQSQNRSRAEERSCQDTSKDVVKDEGIQQSKNRPEDVSSQRQLDLLHFYKKKAHEPDVRSHPDHRPYHNNGEKTSLYSCLGSREVNERDPSGLQAITSNYGTPNTPPDALPTPPSTNTPNITTIDSIMYQESTMQEKSHTSIASSTTSIPSTPTSHLFQVADPEISAGCVVPTLPSFGCPLPVPQNSYSPASSSRVGLLGSRSCLNRKKETGVTRDPTEKSLTKEDASVDLEAGKCTKGMVQQDVYERPAPKEASQNSKSTPHYNIMIQPLLSSASTSRRVIEQTTESEHGGEKELRCDDMNEEVPKSIDSALRNVSADEPGMESINFINHTTSIPDTFAKTGGGNSLHGLMISSQKSSLSGDDSTNRPMDTALQDTITRRMTRSPILGSQEKPIDLFTPVKRTTGIKCSPTSHMSIAKLKQKPSEIHPFFRRSANTVPPSAIDTDRIAGEDVTLRITPPTSNTAGSAKARARIEKGKRNKDITGYEAQCDNPRGDGHANVIFSHSGSDKAHFWYSRSVNSFSGSSVGVTNAMRGSSSLRLASSRAQTQQAPWPNSENQHVLPSQRLTARKQEVFVKRSRTGRYEIDEQQSLAEQLGLNGSESVPLDPGVVLPSLHTIGDSTIRRIIKSIPKEYQEHPGVARVISVIKKQRDEEMGKEAGKNTETPPSYSMWTTKWRPRRAAEVLGNESHALYLREWLKALSIQDKERLTTLTEEHRKDSGREDTRGQKKKRKKQDGEARGRKQPKVIRRITKRKRRRIGSSEDENEDTSWIVDDDEGESDGDAGRDEEEWVPSEGKLPGEDYDNSEVLEGEFSKRLTNTILLAGRPGTGKTSAVYACAAELGWEIFEVYPGIGKRTGINVSGLIGDVGKNHIVGKGIRQSIILLEEVDILFKEDINFWTSVVNIISTSHRPVILTCNDASLVPQGDLPLQRCLKFEACPCGLASSFLQTVCIAEGYDVTRKRVEEEYALMGGDEPEWPPSVAFPSEALPSADLRSALNRLQMGLEFPVSQEEYFGSFTEWRVGEHTLKDCELYAESASYIDAYLNRIKQKPGFETQGDDEIGYTSLTNPEGYPSMGVSKNDSMACDALACCRHVVNVPLSECQVSQTQFGHRWLIQTRRLLARQAASFLDELINLPGPLLPRHEAVLEYIPVIRWLVALDDMQEDPPYSATVPRRRWRHVRHMDLSGEALKAVREYYDMFFPRCIT